MQTQMQMTGAVPVVVLGAAQPFAVQFKVSFPPPFILTYHTSSVLIIYHTLDDHHSFDLNTLYPSHVGNCTESEIQASRLYTKINRPSSFRIKQNKWETASRTHRVLPKRVVKF